MVDMEHQVFFSPFVPVRAVLRVGTTGRCLTAARPKPALRRPSPRFFVYFRIFASLMSRKLFSRRSSGEAAVSQTQSRRGPTLLFESYGRRGELHARRYDEASDARIVH